MKALVLINEKSGAVQSVGVGAIRQIAEGAQGKISDLEVEVTHGEAEALIKAAERREEFDLIAAAGGDGTQAAIASVLMGSRTAQLPLPCGTMNMLCRDLGLSLDIEEALLQGLRGERQQIDVGVANERVFLNNIVFGAYAEMAEAREELRDAETLEDVSFGLVAGANALFHADAMTFNLKFDGKHRTIKTNTIAVSNNAISGADNLTPSRAQLDAGELFVYLTGAQHGGDFASILAEFAAGAAKESNEIEIQACAYCDIDADGKTFSYSIDGDPVEASEAVTMQIKPSALTVQKPKVKTASSNAR